MEARNVVDGLALVEATGGRPIRTGSRACPAAGTAAAAAIAAEIDRAHDALDAVSDLLLAESVHQAVQGNSTAPSAALQALTAPEAPPEPEIIRTPRSGRVLTFRVAARARRERDRRLVVGAVDHARRANPQLNHWLASTCPRRLHDRSGRCGTALRRRSVQSFDGSRP